MISPNLCMRLLIVACAMCDFCHYVIKGFTYLLTYISWCSSCRLAFWLLWPNKTFAISLAYTISLGLQCREDRLLWQAESYAHLVTTY